MHVRVYMCIHIHIWPCPCMLPCNHMHMCVCVFIYTHAHAHTWASSARQPPGCRAPAQSRAIVSRATVSRATVTSAIVSSATVSRATVSCVAPAQSRAAWRAPRTCTRSSAGSPARVQYIYIHIHMYIHRHTHTHIHTHIYIYRTRSRACACMHTMMRTRARVCTRRTSGGQPRLSSSERLGRGIMLQMIATTSSQLSLPAYGTLRASTCMYQEAEGRFR